MVVVNRRSTTATLNDILLDSATPTWAVDLVIRLRTVDTVVAANILNVLAGVYSVRAKRMREREPFPGEAKS